MNAVDKKTKIQTAIQSFKNNNLYENAINLFTTLGYNTYRQSRLDCNTFEGFKESFIESGDNFKEDKALKDDWKKIELLFQLTKSEMTTQIDMFDTGKINNTIYESYIFFAIELKNKNYTRTQLAQITREINKLFKMPVMILFKYGELLTLSIINRRLHKRDETKDVLQKVILIKDININDTHRAHKDILFDLSFDELYKKYRFTNFVNFQKALEGVLDTKSSEDFNLSKNEK